MPSVVSTRTLARGAKFDFVEAAVRRDGPRAGEHTRQFVRHPGAVVIVPVLDDGRLVLIRSYRAAVNETIFEFPAGTLEPGEPPATTAGRELIEETGYEARTIVPLGEFLTSPGLSDERMHAFAATGLTHVGQDLEDNEDIEVVPTPADEVFAMLRDGRLVDAKSMLALLLAQRAGALGEEGSA
ncbi:MAG: NUDIX hydrolase [Phycisphaerales bacterium]